MEGGLEKEVKDQEYLKSHSRKGQMSGLRQCSGDGEWEQERAWDNSQTSSYGVWEDGRAIQKHKEYSKSGDADFILIHIEFVISGNKWNFKYLMSHILCKS